MMTMINYNRDIYVVISFVLSHSNQLFRIDFFKLIYYKYLSCFSPEVNILLCLFINYHYDQMNFNQTDSEESDKIDVYSSVTVSVEGS